MEEVAGFVSYSFKPTPSISTTLSLSIPQPNSLQGECSHFGGKCNELKIEVEAELLGRRLDKELNMLSRGRNRNRKAHPLPLLGPFLPVPVWVITETALYILENKREDL